MAASPPPLGENLSPLLPLPFSEEVGKISRLNNQEHQDD
jgi:hypothetical protein